MDGQADVANDVAVQQAVAAFAAEITNWRQVRGMSKKQLAQRMSFDPSYISHIECGRARPSEEFARLAEAILNAGKEIWRRYQDFAACARRGRPAPVLAAPEPYTAGAALLVEHDEAALDYDQGRYQLRMRRKICNTGSEPVTRYLIRISVDRYPGEPDRSNAHYRRHPLTWEELALSATCQDEPMHWTAKHDRDAFKEVWLRFENDDGRFPLYPGEQAWLEYSYTVSDQKWGRWFQRAVRLPTQYLAVELAFPSALDPVVWGTETSMTCEAIPLRTAPSQHEHQGRRVFSWSTTAPPLNARYRLEWRFKAKPSDHEETTPP
ncbi:helix-turn-helix domain-containing protein [Nonomuraea turcica]|uniref:helix-turn-helix domain-containing protein n=1 Tax=Nonomuraea sp. G32 TaxID=3067274 RepID=UPI00273CEE77|nr:helix-turn-helix transcriptional regulator [Nonomuraea sp. G32]MDP4510350.1 helix-turn-helix transcriptional regulator [Nonomuraea sp. G32]